MASGGGTSSNLVGEQGSSNNTSTWWNSQTSPQASIEREMEFRYGRARERHSNFITDRMVRDWSRRDYVGRPSASAAFVALRPNTGGGGGGRSSSGGGGFGGGSSGGGGGAGGGF